MTRRLLVSYVGITMVVLAALEIPLGVVFERSEYRNLLSELKHDALAVSVLSDETLEGAAHTDLMKLAQRYEKQTGARVVITDKTGMLVADSSATKLVRRSFANRPEIASALAGHEVTGTRYSSSLRTKLLYVAAPVASDGKIFGTVRITYTPTVVAARVGRGWTVLAIFGASVLIAVFGLSIVLARSVTRPIRDLDDVSGRLASGDLSARADPSEGPEEIRILATSFNTMASRMETLLRSQEEFVADASHQLRTPLQALRLRLENAEASPDAEEIRGALTEVERLGRLVEGLLALARAEGDAPQQTPIDVEELVAERLRAWDALARERSVDLRADATPAHVMATPGHVEQALDNLIANAIDVSPPGGAVEISTVHNDGWVEVHVVDHGPGMSAAERARAMDRFWRAPNTARKGSGLGLAIARRLSEIDGGALRLDEASGGGVDAVIRLHGRRR